MVKQTAHNIQLIGIIDIGSNTLRLCVYESNSRVPLPIYNEKAVCGLGRGLAGSGELNPQGVIAAKAAMERFLILSRAMGVGRLDVLATSAVRDASDGPQFVADLEQTHNIKVAVLSGEEEARIAAYGVICGQPDADGIVADLGGGSLELINIKNGLAVDCISLPLGVLRLSDLSGDDRHRAALVVKSYLEDVPWLNKGHGRSLYVVGGSWRALARLLLNRINHPLMILDGFSLSASQALPMVESLATQGRKELEKISSIPNRRLQTLPMAGLVLEHLLRVISPENLVFSIFGMREGHFFTILSKDICKEDPLLWTCHRLVNLHARFPEHSEELMAWTKLLFPNETPIQARIRHATALLSDIFWDEHPDYRAEQAFLRILRLPFMGISHTNRVAVAYSVYCRYQGENNTPQVKLANQLLDQETLDRCCVMGKALRLAHVLSGGAPNLLKDIGLVTNDGNLVVEMSQDFPDLEENRICLLEKLARSLDFSNPIIRRVDTTTQ